MSGKTFFIDLTKCTACRGCQVACKQWHKLPAEATKQLGTHQNPQDLSFTTYKLVRFKEIEDKGGGLRWLFFPEQCRHCVEPPCKAVADGYDERAIIRDELTGAVIYTEFTKAINDLQPNELCPFNIPRKDPVSGIWGKCDMCLDRVHNGLKPACVQSCPTGAMNFGERDDMLALAEKSLEAAKKRFPKAEMANVDDVRVVVLCAYPPADYYEFLMADAGPNLAPMTRKAMLAMLARPFRQS
jgi:formate dehydrogenase iron-sulfur subunit